MNKWILMFAACASMLTLPAQQFDTLDLGSQDEVMTKSMTYNLQDTVYAAETLQVRVINPARFVAYSADAKVTMDGTGKGQLNVNFGPNQNVTYDGLVLIESDRHLVRVLTTDGQGVFTNSYYQSTRNLSEEALKQQLKQITGNGYVNLGYTTARDRMYGQIDNHNGQVECVYTGTKATFNDRPGANANGFNTEHTFPQGFYNSNEPERADIHHLFPTTVTSNSRRGNDPFGNVSNPSWQQGGSSSGGGYFEPRDAHKGACARAMMYFVIRYGDYNNGSGFPFFQLQQNTLLFWHRSNQPGAAEIQRNNDIFSYQKNRNPFVDYPQFADRITTFSGTSTEPPSAGLATSITFRDHIHNDSISRKEYQFVWYNSGNQTVTITSLEQKSSLAKMHLDTTNHWKRQIPPGDFSYFTIYADGDINGWLDYDDSLIVTSDAPGYERKAIRIKGRWLNNDSTTVDGLNENLSVQKFNLYPNPTREWIAWEGWEANGPLIHYRILDLNGRLVESGNLTDQGRVNVAALEPGNYLFQAWPDGQLPQTLQFTRSQD